VRPASWLLVLWHLTPTWAYAAAIYGGVGSPASIPLGTVAHRGSSPSQYHNNTSIGVGAQARQQLALRAGPPQEAERPPLAGRNNWANKAPECPEPDANVDPRAFKPAVEAMVEAVASEPMASIAMPTVSMPAAVGVPWHRTDQEQHHQDDDCPHPLPPCSHGHYLSRLAHTRMFPGMVLTISPALPVQSHGDAMKEVEARCLWLMLLTLPLFS
jgi:hypothetical protein